MAADHYHIPPLERIDLDTVLGLIRDKKYFVLHAPRQTGKTSALLTLRDLLNGGGHGDFRCVYANVEDGQAMRENVAEGMRTALAEGVRPEHPPAAERLLVEAGYPRGADGVRFKVTYDHRDVIDLGWVEIVAGNTVQRTRGGRDD